VFAAFLTVATIHEAVTRGSGCVNCVNTLPHVTELYAKYKDRGLVVVGVTRRNSRSSDQRRMCAPR
jgi:hypothetical protein